MCICSPYSSLLLDKQVANHLSVMQSQKCLPLLDTPVLLRVPTGPIFLMVLISCGRKLELIKGLLVDTSGFTAWRTGDI